MDALKGHHYFAVGMLDTLTIDEVVWCPYADEGDDQPEVVRDGCFLFDRENWLLCFSLVYCHSISTTTRQLGQCQGLPLSLLLPPAFLMRGAPRDHVFAEIFHKQVEDCRQGYQRTPVGIE